MRCSAIREKVAPGAFYLKQAQLRRRLRKQVNKAVVEGAWGVY